MSTPVHVYGAERGAHLRVVVTRAERLQERRHLGLVDLAIAVGVDAFEAVAQRVQGHALSLRRLLRAGEVAACALAVTGCQKDADNRGFTAYEPPAAARVEPHPVVSAEATRGGPPLRGDWMVEVDDLEQKSVVMPPVGAVAPARLVIGVHGAGDRADWACGGWRLGSQVTSFIACPQGHPMGKSTFGWVSAQQLEERALGALNAVKARYPDYLADAPYIFAGFSQGATLAEPFLRKHAKLFPIAILAEGGYRTMTSPSFAAAYRAGGGRRVVLVCGGPTCFLTARSAVKVLERAGLQALVVGDEKAGHNLNDLMQRALQDAWPRIVAPIPS